MERMQPQADTHNPQLLGAEALHSRFLRNLYLLIWLLISTFQYTFLSKSVNCFCFGCYSSRLWKLNRVALIYSQARQQLCLPRYPCCTTEVGTPPACKQASKWGKKRVKFLVWGNPELSCCEEVSCTSGVEVLRAEARRKQSSFH